MARKRAYEECQPTAEHTARDAEEGANLATSDTLRRGSASSVDSQKLGLCQSLLTDDLQLFPDDGFASFAFVKLNQLREQLRCISGS